MAVELAENLPGIQQAEAKLFKLNKDLAFQLTQMGVDVAGIFDPTPTSDILGAGMSLASGDLIGAGLSLVSLIPYAGDALAKTAKGVRVLKKINNLRKQISAAIPLVNKARRLANLARKKIAAKIRAKLAKEAAEKVAKKANCKQCKEAGENLFGTQSPKKGFKGDRGNSEWNPLDSDLTNAEEVKKAMNQFKDANGNPIETIKFKDGYPDFSPFSKKTVEIDMTGNYKLDFDAANKAADFPTTPKDYTWHHVEDGTTMQLIPSAINKVPHKGGRAIVKDPNY